jgi:hypothetical protein
MLTIEECKRILNRRAKQYSEDEIEQIRDFLLEIAQIEVKNLEKQSKDENSSIDEQGEQ